MTKEKTIKVKRKDRTGPFVYRTEGDELKDRVVIKKNQIWDCPESFIKRLHPDLWDILDPAEEKTMGGPSRRQPPKPKVGLSVIECEGGFDVVNGKTGNRVNDEPLTKEEAEGLVKETGENV